MTPKPNKNELDAMNSPVGKTSEWIDRLTVTFIKWRIRKGWGANCKTLDRLDFPDQPQSLMGTEKYGRCGSCQAKEVIEWLDYWIKLIREIK